MNEVHSTVSTFDDMISFKEQCAAQWSVQMVQNLWKEMNTSFWLICWTQELKPNFLTMAALCNC